MADDAHLLSSQTDSKDLNFPTPLSPPLPAISKQIELSRAMTASSKSSIFSITRSEFLFEDEWMIGVDKTPGIYCEAVLSSVRQLLGESGDSNEIVTKRSRKYSGAEVTQLELHLANRLDRDTTGVMLVTKSHRVAGKLVKVFTDHKVKKTYLALCVAPAPKWEKISLKSGHGRSKYGAFRVYSASDIGRSLPGGSVVREMVTSFEILSINGRGTYKEPNKFDMDELKPLSIEGRPPVQSSEEQKDEILIRAYPQSGRTHQIRLHCQYLGIPIRGDVKYEGVYEWKGATYEAHALQAESLSFDHPVTGVAVELRAPLPLWARETMPQPS
ncbi:RNA pseudouridine synthase 1 [Aristolochia californica]|uniref:RNA pseudouridine synthase 1 n=1 Tax=Aristolochia californica TaxID=171875 RepID=UPI0035D8FEE2